VFAAANYLLISAVKLFASAAAARSGRTATAGVRYHVKIEG